MVDKYIIGLVLLLGGLFLLNFDEIFYPEIIEDEYQRCDSICVRENETLPCNCVDVVKDKSTTPLWYGLTLLAIILFGAILMVLSYLNMKDVKK